MGTTGTRSGKRREGEATGFTRRAVRDSPLSGNSRSPPLPPPPGGTEEMGRAPGPGPEMMAEDGGGCGTSSEDHGSGWPLPPQRKSY